MLNVQAASGIGLVLHTHGVSVGYVLKIPHGVFSHSLSFCSAKLALRLIYRWFLTLWQARRQSSPDVHHLVYALRLNAHDGRMDCRRRD
jgi:hypothetical protein